MIALGTIACATCRLDPSQPAFIAEQNMLTFMLTLTMVMLGAIVLIGFNFARKARRAAPLLPTSNP